MRLPVGARPVDPSARVEIPETGYDAYPDKNYGQKLSKKALAPMPLEKPVVAKVVSVPQENTGHGRVVGIVKVLNGTDEALTARDICRMYQNDPRESDYLTTNSILNVMASLGLVKKVGYDAGKSMRFTYQRPVGTKLPLAE